MTKHLGFLWDFGRCSKCLKKAFLIAMGCWASAGLLFAVKNEDLVPIAMGLAIAFTMLWATHIVAYAGREALLGSAVGDGSDSRRSFLSIFVKMAALGAAVSLPMAAYAWSSCGGWKAGDCDACSKRETANSPCTRCRNCGESCGSNTC